MKDDIVRILISDSRIKARVSELGREMADIYDSKSGLTIVAILNGALIFLADLMREIPLKMRISLMTVSSYPDASVESRGPKLIAGLGDEVRDRHVLLVDDILDTGNTLRFVQREILDRGPASLRTCVLLRKTAKAPSDVKADFVGFDIEDEFVVGYGLDYNNLYRNYPHIGVLRPEVY